MLHYMRALIQTRVNSERGATAVEYGLLVVLIAAVIVLAVATLGKEILGGFTEVNTELQKP